MKKIMFNDRYGLTQAVLEGRKTMTRRLVPIKEAKRLEAFFDGDDWDYAKQTCIDDSATYKIGEVVAVAQSYNSIIDEMFANDYTSPIYDPFRSKKPDLEEEKGWTNKMFVKADLMPHLIRITNIKVERLKDISDEDCLREGIKKYGFMTYHWEDIKTLYCKSYKSSREAFADLIDKVSGRGTWVRNPWVFAYSFELIK